VPPGDADREGEPEEERLRRRTGPFAHVRGVVRAAGMGDPTGEGTTYTESTPSFREDGGKM